MTHEFATPHLLKLYTAMKPRERRKKRAYFIYKQRFWKGAGNKMQAGYFGRLIRIINQAEKANFERSE